MQTLHGLLGDVGTALLRQLYFKVIRCFLDVLGTDCEYAPLVEGGPRELVGYHLRQLLVLALAIGDEHERLLPILPREAFGSHLGHICLL